LLKESRPKYCCKKVEPTEEEVKNPNSETGEKLPR
jgi:hypothetical protein